MRFHFSVAHRIHLQVRDVFFFITEEWGRLFLTFLFFPVSTRSHEVDAIQNQHKGLFQSLGYVVIMLIFIDLWNWNLEIERFHSRSDSSNSELWCSLTFCDGRRLFHTKVNIWDLLWKWRLRWRIIESKNFPHHYFEEGWSHKRTLFCSILINSLGNNYPC